MNHRPEWMDRQLSKTIVRQQIELHMKKFKYDTQWFWDYYAHRLYKIDGVRRGFNMTMTDWGTCQKISEMVVRSRK